MKPDLPFVAPSIAALLALCPSSPLGAQQATDANTPLHLLQPEYETPYGVPERDAIIAVLDRVHDYLDQTTPAQLVDAASGEPVEDFSTIPELEEIAFKQGDFRIMSYEWGVTYAGMLLATEATGDPSYADYAFERLAFLAEIRPHLLELEERRPEARHPLGSMLHPDSLDDAGAMCAAMIKARRAGLEAELGPVIDTYIRQVHEKQFRLEDGTLARNRPQPRSLWLDDLFMSVPALAWMGAETGEARYFDDAVRQVTLFSDRMFDREEGLFIHAWIDGMDPHPEFHWARANGWAVMAVIELLEVLPEDHAGRGEVLGILRNHLRGLAAVQSSTGLWHQLLDRDDSYLETSATAIYTYALARAINRGYVDAKAYGPVACLAWNGLATKVNDKGQVEGTCVGTGMGFDPAFYYHRPVSAFAAHGYGPVLLAGAEMIRLLDRTHPRMNDSAVQFYDVEIQTDEPIFRVGE